MVMFNVEKMEGISFLGVKSNPNTALALEVEKYSLSLPEDLSEKL